jgi:hypothetical protein
MDLDAMRARVRKDLRDEDPEHERWPDETLDRHIARALAELSLAAPLEATATLQTEAGSRDLSLAGLGDRVSVDAVEHPPGRYPPALVAFSTWGDTLTLLVERTPAGGEDVLVRYARLHALDAEGTTLPEALHDLVATGAAGYAAVEWASYAINRVNLGGEQAWRHYQVWGQERLAAFAKALAKHGRARQVRSRRLYVPVPASLGGRDVVQGP